MRLLGDSACADHEVKLLIHPTVVELQLLGVETTEQIVAIQTVIHRVLARDGVLGVLVLLRKAIATRQREHHLQQVIILVEWFHIRCAQRIAIGVIARQGALVHHGGVSQLVVGVGLGGASGVGEVHVGLHGQGASWAHELAVVGGTQSCGDVLR